MESLEELKKQLKEISEKIEKIEKVEKNKRWRAGVGERYYCIDRNGRNNYFSDNDDAMDNYYHKTRNYFRTAEEAQRHLDNINTYYELMDLAEELNNGEEIDWKDSSQKKYHLCFDTARENIVKFYYNTNKDSGQIYCLDENFLEKAKERIGEKRLINLFKGV